MQLAPNSVIAGRFRLNRPIGRGAMGSVWHATHLGLDIPCAVKFIEASNAQVPEAIARFEREAKSAAQLRSPNVVQILDHGVSDGTPYIAMELLDGEDLGKRLAREGRLPPKLAYGIVRDVCRALTKAHAANIVHRDLKPDNIFLVRDDDREIAKVLDFGIAKAKSVDGAATRAGEMLGTPYYMSPEQVQGAQLVDARSDLWSLAVIAFRCVTGKLPFEAKTLAELMMKIIVEPLPVPSDVAPDVPRRFDLWWARAAERDREKRFQSAKDLDIALALAFGLSPAAGKKVGGTVEMPMTGGPDATPNAPQPPMLATGPQRMSSSPAHAATPAPLPYPQVQPQHAHMASRPQSDHAALAARTASTRATSRPSSAGVWVLVIGSIIVVALAITIVIVLVSRSSSAPTAPSSAPNSSAHSSTGQGGAAAESAESTGSTESPTPTSGGTTSPNATSSATSKGAPDASPKHDPGGHPVHPRRPDLGF